MTLLTLGSLRHGCLLKAVQPKALELYAWTIGKCAEVEDFCRDLGLALRK
jgi:hypothetical protein